MSSPAFAIPPDLTRDTGTWPGDGPIRWGSDEHKRLFCKTLLDTHDPYKPAVLDWPKLGEEAEKRITVLADLGHRGADRKSRRPECLHLCRKRARSAAAQGDRAQRL